MHNTGSLYIVATPIGNLEDFSLRGQKTLSSVALILAEDTRHSKRLTNHFGITTRLKSCHEHNESEQIAWVIEQLDKGDDIALISDAGTPLISDPGFVLVRALRNQGYPVVTVPGPCSIIAALAIAGLPTDRFVFDGFLPSKSSMRSKQLEHYLAESRTIVLLESSHRIQASLEDLATVLGGNRNMVIARELTKKFETVVSGSIEDVAEVLRSDPNQCRGEFVLMLEGVAQQELEHADLLSLLTTLETELPLKKAAGLAAKITGRRKNELYDMALKARQG